MKTLVTRFALIAAFAVSSAAFATLAKADCQYAGSTYSCEADDTFGGIGKSAPEPVSGPSEDERADSTE